MKKQMGILVLIALLAVGVAYAWGGGAVKIYVPPIIRTSTNTVNISIGNGNGNVTNCTIERYSTLAEATTWTVASANESAIFNSTTCEAASGTACATAANATVQLTAYNISSGDATDWQFRGRCRNTSNAADYTSYSTTVSSITVDYTQPVLTLTSPTTASLDTDGLVTFNYACVNTTSATLYIESNAYTMAESADVCTYTNPGTSKLTNGIQSWYIVASDGTNSTTSATTTVEIRKPGGPVTDESETTPTTTTETTSNGGIAGNSVLAFVVFAGIIWYMVSSKKKGKR